MYQNLIHIRDIMRLASGSFALFFATAGVGLLAAAGEAAGIFAFIPLFQMSGAAMTGPKDSYLTKAFGWLNGMTFEHQVQSIAVLIIIVVVVRAAMEFLNKGMTSALRMIVQRRLAVDIYAGIIFANLGYIDRQRGGRMTAQIENFVFQISRILGNLGNLLFNSILMFVYVGLMILVSVQLTLLAILMMLVVSAAFTLLLFEQDRLGRKLIGANIEYHHAIAETVSNIRLLRLLGAEQSRLGHFTAIVRDKTWVEFLMYSINSSTQPIFTLSGGLFFAGALFFGAWYFGDDRTWLPSAILLIVILYRMMAPISAMNAARAELNGDLPILEELQKFRAETLSNRFVNGTHKVRAFERSIAFDHVTFKYDREPDVAQSGADISRPQLNDFHCEIQKGEMIALVGQTGSGKTTVVNLLARLYDPTSGRIAVDGVDLKDLDIYSWRPRIGFVSQDVTLFHGTIADNLRIVNRKATVSDLEDALRAAGAADLLTDLPFGLDTAVGDRGATLSGGQRQRIALARALLQEFDILILDEATNQLDSLTERAVSDTIARMKGRAMVIAIAHRLNTIAQADRILVLEKGRIVQSGRHKELSSQDGLYRHLLTEQSSGLVALPQENQPS